MLIADMVVRSVPLGIEPFRLSSFNRTPNAAKLDDLEVCRNCDVGLTGHVTPCARRFHPRHAWIKKAAAMRNMNNEKNCPLVNTPTNAASGSRNCSPMIRNVA